MKRLHAHWEEVATLLREARAALPVGPGASGDRGAVPVGTLFGTLDEFEEFMGHRELGLARDALAAVATPAVGRDEVWSRLAQAADKMGLHSKRDEALKRLARQM